MPKFNSALGTLTGVTIYFYAREDVTTLTITNQSNSSSATFDASATTNFVKSMTNSATAADKFSSGSQSLVYFDTGNATGIGNCSDNGAGTVLPNACTSLTYASLESHSFGPFNFSNIDTYYLNAGSLQSGTGVQGLTGVKRTGTAISNYVGVGNWTLSGTTDNILSLSGNSGNILFSQQTQARFQAEVDYTYTPAAVPEPATMVLMGSALAGVAVLRKRFTK